MTISVRLIAVLALCLAIPACGGSSKPLARVEGQVTLNGQPLPSGIIVFESAGQRPANGKIQDGKIVEVTTFNPGDGVLQGSHKVAIQSAGEVGAAVTSDPSQDASSQPGYMGVTNSSTLPERYRNPATSGLTAEITKGTNEVKFELTSP